MIMIKTVRYHETYRTEVVGTNLRAQFEDTIEDVILPINAVIIVPLERRVPASPRDVLRISRAASRQPC
jgi:hypothetical protein